MYYLFVDESERANDEFSNHFVLFGIAISSESIIPLERHIHNFKKKHSLKNLKELRDTRRFYRPKKFELMKELYDSLEDFDVVFVASILGKISLRTLDLHSKYDEGLSFVVERFFFMLHEKKDQGLVILDSNSNKVMNNIVQNQRNFILTQKRWGNPIRKRVYATTLFCKDEYSNILQLSDLCAAGLQNAVYDFNKQNSKKIFPKPLKDNEEELIEYGFYVSLYWKYFRIHKGNIRGGLKYWP